MSLTEEFTVMGHVWNSTTLTIGVITLFVACLLWYFFSRTPMPLLPSLPPLTSFVGREQDISVLQPVLEFSSTTPRIVSITGGPGFGKSTLAIYMGHKLKDEGIHVVYIDMAEVSSMHTLAFKVLQISQNSLSKRNITVQDLYEWSLLLKHETLLILDNCDEQFHTIKDSLQETIENLTKKSKHSNLKILTTSRHHVAYLERHHPHVITELPVMNACQLLLALTNCLDNASCEKFANITGSVPLALRVIGALLNMPNPPSPKKILSKLNENLLRTLSPEELKTKDRVNASIYVSYEYLRDNRTRKVGRYLSNFPGSFKEDDAIQIVNKLFSGKIDALEHLQILVRRSLLVHNQDSSRYQYHTLIKEFFESRSTPQEADRFNIQYMDHYGSVLEKIAEGSSPQAALEFLINKHDFNHFFDLLSNNGNKSFNKMFIKVADVVRNFIHSNEHNFLDWIFEG